MAWLLCSLARDRTALRMEAVAVEMARLCTAASSEDDVAAIAMLRRTSLACICAIDWCISLQAATHAHQSHIEAF